MRRANAYWLLTLSYRYQGRLVEALLAAREQQRFTKLGLPEAAPPAGGIAEAQVLFELGRYREAAALFDAIAHWTPATLPASAASGALGRHRAWHLTHTADALAAVGDTAGLASRADTIQRYGAESAYRLHRQLHHHVRGLLLAARGRDDDAIVEFRQAIFSPNTGYTRTNYELARLYLRHGRAREALAVLQPALRGSIEASNLYITRTELHEMLAQAWEALNGSAARDSAAAHWTAVTHAWKRADPMFAGRVRHAEERLAALGAR
jgi:tetratricopeptide (TPR) repeat protein